MDGYISLRFQIPDSLEEDLPELLGPWPILGTVVEPGSDGMQRVVTYTEARDSPAIAEMASMLNGVGATDLSVEEIAVHDWLARYREATLPFSIGRRWWIDPRPDTPSPAPPDRRRLVIEPRMAFGSGSHESTQLILEALERMDLVGLDVLDLGTGSGILALAADLSGAKRVIAIDIDPSATWVARQVLAQQEWDPSVTLVLGSISGVAASSFDLVLCNMISAHFLPMLADLRGALQEHGRVVFSGILLTEVEDVSMNLAAAGLIIEEQTVMGEWACLTAAVAS